VGDAEHVIDVERLVDELKERVARGRADGSYPDDPALRAGPVAIESGAAAAVNPAPQSRLGEAAAPVPAPRVVYLPGARYASPRRLLGAVVSFLRRLILRLIHPALDDIARQADAAVVSLHARMEWAESAIPAEARAREGVAFLAEHVERRANDVFAAQRALEESTRDALDEAHDAMRDQRAELLERLEDGLARLERLREEHGELRARQDGLGARQDGLGARQDELDRRQADAGEEQQDVNLRHAERLERLEAATRAQALAGADTMRGLAEHLRQLDARAHALEEELQSLVREVEAVDAPAAR
jgi:hypothetical protein